MTAGWATKASLEHYQSFFGMTLNVPDPHDTSCSMTGDGITVIWCSCNLFQDTVDSCVGLVNIHSPDPAAPALPTRMIIDWWTGRFYPGPAHGWCGYENAASDCDNFQLQNNANITKEPFGDKTPYPQDRIDAIKGNSWPASDLRHALFGCYTPAQGYCSSIDQPGPGAPSRPTSADSTHPGTTSRSLERRDADGANTLTLKAGWYTDAVKSHYKVEQLDVSLTVTYQTGSGVSCAIAADGFTHVWCSCTPDPATHQISTCAGVASISSNDASAPVMPTNIYIRWRPTGKNPGINGALCGWTDHLSNWDPRGQCKGFGMINPGHWIMNNAADWVETYVQRIKPQFALALSMNEPMVEQRNKFDKCMTNPAECPPAAPVLPIVPPWSPSGLRRSIRSADSIRMVPRVDAPASGNAGSLSIEAGWITEAAQTHYNTEQIPMTLSVNWNAGSGLQCNVTGTGTSTLWCECSTDASHLVKDCAAVANIASPDPSAPVLPSALYIRWYPRGGQVGIVQGMCGWPDDPRDDSSQTQDQKGACKGFMFFNWGNVPFANVASWPAVSLQQTINPRYALGFPVEVDPGQLQDDMRSCAEDSKRCPEHGPVLPIRDTTFLVEGAP